MGQRDRKVFPASQREVSAEELSAEILKSLREDVRRQADVDMTTAVITVPAAFGALQCEATARAAELAGFVEAPLLQEPIAAAVGYGANPDDGGRRLLVFDLGGGTLDIAVISTRDGRLNVLEHRGNNLLGGKDIDRAIVDGVLLPPLEATFDLRKRMASGLARSAFLSRLRMKAEEAKIDLSRDTNVTISLFDLGVDDAGVAIELDVPLGRRQLEALSEPLLGKCCDLADEALAGARIKGSEIDRIVLVGGPTQSPFLRKFLGDRLGAPVDFSADPMTVVCRGAAIYASTLKKTSSSTIAGEAATGPAKAGLIDLKLSYEPVSAELICPVAGRISEDGRNVEIRIDSALDAWTSGWQPLQKGFFEILVSLTEGEVNTFWIYCRNPEGNLLDTAISEFKIRHGLVPSAPPLPNPLSVEILGADGKPFLDPIFAKGSPLPAEQTIRYRAAHAVKPSDPASGLAIKLWEGEYYDDPDANDWVGHVLIDPADVKQTIAQGS